MSPLTCTVTNGRCSPIQATASGVDVRPVQLAAGCHLLEPSQHPPAATAEVKDPPVVRERAPGESQDPGRLLHRLAPAVKEAISVAIPGDALDEFLARKWAVLDPRHGREP
jgi:hypothetical protein